MKIESIKRKLDIKLRKYFKSLGYSDSEIDEQRLFRIESRPNKDKKYTDIYVYAEMSMEEFFDSVDIWNDIVIKYDPSAYFDVVEPGVFLARIYWAAMPNENDSEEVLTKANLTKLGELICLDLEDEYDEVFYVDEIQYQEKSQRLVIEVSSTVLESRASMKVYEYDLETYRDLVDTCEDKLVQRLNNGMQEI